MTPTPARAPTPWRTVGARAGSYGVLGLALAVAVALGTPGIAGLSIVLGAIGLVEWSRLADLPLHHRIALQVANVVILTLVAWLGAGAAEWIVGGTILAGLAWPVVRADPSRAMRDLGFAALGVILLPGLLAHGVALSVEHGPAGAATFAALAVAVALSDVGAFLVGRRYGQTPLAARLSPNKTRAGVAGNLAGAAIGILVFAPVLEPAFGVPFVILLIPLVAAGAVWGDLLESAAKREAGVKDAAGWLPGFGGILDRIDSLLVTLPLAFWTLRLLELVRGGAGA
ncbi:MAG TPA: phosphatidate cytidylyltransferase [Candidatus Limnocylindrales bacterium]|nr:phosphatidate cytidylyltransferase [Candidatus Limnocylindrales bacterium]